MAGNEGRGYDKPAFIAGEDLQDYQWHFMYLSDDNTVKVCDSGNEDVIGILENKPAEGQAAKVATVGDFSKLVLGANSITVGKELTAKNDGHGVVVSGGGQYAGAKALMGGDSNDIIEVLVVSGDMHAAV